MAGPLRPSPPPSRAEWPLWKVGTSEKKVPKKVIFSLMARPLREEHFLCGFPNALLKNYIISHSNITM